MRSVNILPAAVALGFSFCAPAKAQVQVYGAIDTYVESYSNGNDRAMRVSSGGNLPSYFGLKGSEKIGDLTVFFRLESAFMADDGQLGESAGHLFNRMSLLGVSGAWGQVSVGRQNTPYFQTLAGNCAANFTLASVIQYFFVPNAMNGSRGPGFDDRLARRDNSLRYDSPRWAGLQMSAYAALGETGDSNRDGNVYNLALHYRHGAWDARLSHLAQKTTWLRANTDRYWAASASYDFGLIKPALVYANRSGSADLAKDMQAWQVGATIPAWRGKFTVNYGQFRNRQLADADASAFGLQYTYPLSKRTAVYLGYTAVENDAQARFTIQGGGYMSRPLESAPGQGPAGADPSAWYLGLSHRF